MAVAVLAVVGPARAQEPVGSTDSAAAPPSTAADGAVEAARAPLRITTSVSPADVAIGTPFRYTVRVEVDAGVDAYPTLLSGAIGDFVITDYGHSGVATGADAGTGADAEPVADAGRGADGDVGDDRGVIEIWYDLLAYESGSQFVPAPRVGYRGPDGEVGEVEGPRALINVDTLLPPAGEEVELRDIKEPVEPPADLRPAVLALAAVLLAVLVAALVYWSGRRRRRRAQGIVRPAHELALEALVRLRGASLISAGRHEDYYVRLSAIVREYVEGRFSLRAPEMTTEEFLTVVGRGEALGRDHRAALGGFLAEADLVKFARHVPSVTDAERAYDAARGFVESTKPHEDGHAAA